MFHSVLDPETESSSVCPSAVKVHKKYYQLCKQYILETEDKIEIKDKVGIKYIVEIKDKVATNDRVENIL